MQAVIKLPAPKKEHKNICFVKAKFWLFIPKTNLVTENHTNMDLTFH